MCTIHTSLKVYFAHSLHTENLHWIRRSAGLIKWGFCRFNFVLWRIWNFFLYIYWKIINSLPFIWLSVTTRVRVSIKAVEVSSSFGTFSFIKKNQNINIFPWNQIIFKNFVKSIDFKTFLIPESKRKQHRFWLYRRPTLEINQS